MSKKILHQTWKTQNLDNKILRLHKKENVINPYLDRVIFTDSQMIDSIESNFDSDTIDYFRRIRNIVAKADFWRYLILYKYGGVYLDIDSSIIGRLNDSFFEHNSGIISYEDNNSLFLQWSLIYSENHPVLERVIENIKLNIDNNLFKDDISSLTGPKLYTKSVLEILKEHSHKKENLNDSDFKNEITEFIVGDYKLKLVPSKIYEKLFLFKHKHTHRLLDRKKGILGDDHWTVHQKKYEVY